MQTHEEVLTLGQNLNLNDQFRLLEGILTISFGY